MVIWRAYENDGVELSKPEGCKTREEAVAICKEEWRYGIEEMGYDPEFDFYIELEEESNSTITILDTIKLKFKQNVKQAVKSSKKAGKASKLR